MNIQLCSLNTLWDKFSFCCSYQFTSIQLLLIKILLPHVDKTGFFGVPGDFFKSSVLSLCTVSSLINALNRVNFTEAPGFSSKGKKNQLILYLILTQFTGVSLFLVNLLFSFIFK